MVPLLPPLAAVRAFEAAARLGSFTRAADELGMSQAAVSYQIKLLEERVGTPLFLREARQVVLTETGRRLSVAATEAFDGLRAAFAALHETSSAVLTLSALHAFASNWLAPRLGAFQLAHPSLAVRLTVSDRLTDFAREEVDAGLRSGHGPWPGLASHRLFPVLFTPMCSPELLARAGPLSEPRDLLALPLLSADDPWWAAWFRQAGVEVRDLTAQGGIRLDMQQMDGAAALAGQGVAMLTPALWVEELRAGRLVQPFALVGDEGRFYWLVYPEGRRRVPKIRAFREWLLAEVARFEAEVQLSAGPAPESRSSPPR
jgi:LysR family glycine cleavage system transcriptional activator